MNVKKEYILLALLIVSSIAYLVFERTDRVHYTLPKLKALKTDEITKIEMTRAGSMTALTKKDDSWYISPNNWRADQTKISEMREKLSGLVVTDLVSESKTYERYGLDDKNKLVLKAYSSNVLKRELDVGKAASTNQHTYIKFPGNEKVYLASGDLPRLFQTPAAELRDMLVFSINPPDITGISVEQHGKKIALTREELPQDKSQKKPDKDAVRLFIWKDEKGAVVDKAKIDAFLAVLSKIYCEGYLDDAMKASLTNPAITLKIKGSKEYGLSIFDKTLQKIPALSSQSESPFVFPGYKLDTLKKSLDEIAKK